MKFLIHIDSKYGEIIDGLANALRSNGHQALFFHNNVYRVFEEQAPDYLIISLEAKNLPEISQFLQKRQPPHLEINSYNLTCPNQNVLNLAGFANTIKYKPQLTQQDFAGDICVVNDGTKPVEIMSFYERHHKDYKIKIIGHFINSPGFIGAASPEDMVKIAKSSRVTLSHDTIIRNSLIYNNICCCSKEDEVLDFLNRDKKEIEQFILAEKRKLITEYKLGQLIIEELSNITRQS